MAQLSNSQQKLLDELMQYYQDSKLSFEDFCNKRYRQGFLIADAMDINSYLSHRLQEGITLKDKLLIIYNNLQTYNIEVKAHIHTVNSLQKLGYLTLIENLDNQYKHIQLNNDKFANITYTF